MSKLVALFLAPRVLLTHSPTALYSPSLVPLFLYQSSLRPIDRFDSPSRWRRNACLILFISLHLPAMARSIYGWAAKLTNKWVGGHAPKSGAAAGLARAFLIRFYRFLGGYALIFVEREDRPWRTQRPAPRHSLLDRHHRLGMRTLQEEPRCHDRPHRGRFTGRKGQIRQMARAANTPASIVKSSPRSKPSRASQNLSAATWRRKTKYFTESRFSGDF